MNFWIGYLASGMSAAVLAAGCSTRQSAPVIERAPPPAAAQPATPAVVAAPAAGAADFYTVKRGDTLISIALNHGQDYRDIAVWNNMSDPNLIRVDQVLRVTPPPGASAGDSGVIVRPVTPPGGASPAPATAARTEPAGAKKPYSDETYAQMQRDANRTAVAVVAAPAIKPEPKPEPRPGEPDADGDDVAWAWPLRGRIIGQFSESGANKGLDIAAKVGDPVLAAGAGRVVYSGQGLRGYGRIVIVKHNNTFLSAYAHNSTLLVKEGQTVARGQKIAEAGNTDSDVPKLHFEIRRQGKPVDPAKFLPEQK